MNQTNPDQIRQNVRSRYKEVALQTIHTGSSCCAPAETNSGCCAATSSYEAVSAQLGYSTDELPQYDSVFSQMLAYPQDFALARLTDDE